MTASDFEAMTSTQDGPHLDPTTEPCFPTTESEWDMMMNCKFDLPFDPLFFWDPSLAMDPCLQSLTLHLEPEPCTYETLVSSTEEIRDRLNKVLADLGDMKSDYQVNIGLITRPVELVVFDTTANRRKGKLKRLTKRPRFCARTLMPQSCDANSWRLTWKKHIQSSWLQS
jgi:hypothetical protein